MLTGPHCGRTSYCPITLRDVSHMESQKHLPNGFRDTQETPFVALRDKLSSIMDKCVWKYVEMPDTSKWSPRV
jgi:hypothetical protein